MESARITDKSKVDFTCRIQSKKRFAPLLCLSLRVPGGSSATLPFARISLRKPSEAVCEPRRVRLGGDPGAMRKKMVRSQPQAPLIHRWPMDSCTRSLRFC
jgi:hypothetical protein